MGAINWQPIETAPRDDEEVLVYINSASVDIVRLAFWNDCEFWQDQGFQSQDDLRGWWSYKHSVTQEKLDEYMTPTHWAPYNPPQASPMTQTMRERMIAMLGTNSGWRHRPDSVETAAMIEALLLTLREPDEDMIVAAWGEKPDVEKLFTTMIDAIREGK